MGLTSDDLLAGLATLGLWLAIAGVIVAFSIWRARKHGSTTLALDVTRNASLAYLGLCVAGAVMSTVTRVSSGWVTLSDDVLSWVTSSEDALNGPQCGVDGTWPVDPMPEQAFLCGRDIENAPIGPRLVLLAATLLGIAASAAIAWAIYTATRRAGLRDPFHPSVARTFGAASIVVMIGAVLGELANSVGLTLAARSLSWADGMDIPFSLSVPLWPFAVAVGLFALSAIFRHGHQLQLERERLQRETEGLI